MRIWKTKVFQSWQKKSDVTDDMLVAAVQDMQKGLIDAELGRNLVKKRIARKDSGKSAGYRTIVATKKKETWFFIYGFAKNEKDNITAQELGGLKDLATYLLGLCESEVTDSVNKKLLTEVENAKKK